MNVVSIARKSTNLLETLDAIRERIAKGEVVALSAVLVTQDDTTIGYTASVGGVTRLRMLGALATLNHSYLNGELDGE